MIPEEYWQLFKQWFWVILLGGLLGAVGAYLVGVVLLGPPNVHSSRVILGIDHFIPYGETASNPETLGTMQAEYVQSLGQFAQTPQFMSRLRDSLPAPLAKLPEPELATRLNVTANQRIFNISVEATGEDSPDAEALAAAAATILVDYAKTSEDTVEAALRTAHDQRRALLSERLVATYGAIESKIRAAGEENIRTALSDLVARGGEADQFRGILISLARVQADAELPFLLSEPAALETEVTELAELDGQLSLATVTDESPLFVAVPAETVEALGEPAIRGRNLAFLGLLSGLIMGWIGANYLERYRASSGTVLAEESSPPDSSGMPSSPRRTPRMNARASQAMLTAETEDTGRHSQPADQRSRRSSRSRPASRPAQEGPSGAGAEPVSGRMNADAEETRGRELTEPSLAFGGGHND